MINDRLPSEYENDVQLDEDAELNFMWKDIDTDNNESIHGPPESYTKEEPSLKDDILVMSGKNLNVVFNVSGTDLFFFGKIVNMMCSYAWRHTNKDIKQFAGADKLP